MYSRIVYTKPITMMIWGRLKVEFAVQNNNAFDNSTMRL